MSFWCSSKKWRKVLRATFRVTFVLKIGKVVIADKLTGIAEVAHSKERSLSIDLYVDNVKDNHYLSPTAQFPSDRIVGHYKLCASPKDSNSLKATSMHPSAHLKRQKHKFQRPNPNCALGSTKER